MKLTEVLDQLQRELVRHGNIKVVATPIEPVFDTIDTGGIIGYDILGVDIAFNDKDEVFAQLLFELTN